MTKKSKLDFHNFYYQRLNWNFDVNCYEFQRTASYLVGIQKIIKYLF